MAPARLSALDHAEQTAQLMLRAALVAQVKAYIHDTAAPELKERIEHELENQTGAAVASAVTQTATSDAAAHPGTDAKQDAQALTQAGKSATDPALRAAVENQIRNQAVPQLAQQVTSAVGTELQKAGIPPAEFQDQVKQDINNALTTEMAGTVSTEAAWHPSEAQSGAADTAALDKAHDEVAAAAARLNALGEQQEQIRQDGQDAQQQPLAGDIGDAESGARQALTDAKASSSSADHDIDQGMNSLRNRTASSAANAAVAALGKNDRSDADHAQQDTKAALSDDAAQLATVATSVAQESSAAKAAEQAQAPGSGLDAAALAAITAKLSAIPTSGAKSVADAAGQMQVGGVLGDAASLARLRALAATLAQARLNAGQGRALGDPTLFGAPGAGMMLGKGKLTHSRAMHESFNRAVYEAFVKDMRNRTHPNNAYQPVDAVNGLDSIADPEQGPFPAAVWASPLTPDVPPTNAPQRVVPPPSFKTIAFGAAGMMEGAVTIDGDLSDWGKLEHPLVMQYHSNDGTTPFTGGTPLYMRWSNQGLYFAYTVATPTGLHPTDVQPYSGDCLEVFIDLENQRLDQMGKSQYTHQFCFDPFGFHGDKNCTFVEIGRDQRGLKMFQAYADHTGTRGRSAVHLIPGGYVVEAFVARTTLAKPVLVPGAYLAVNFSINTDPNTVQGAEQWSASKALQTWNRPDTWGDILLLGSDATVRALNSDNTVATQLVPGQVLQVEVTDHDMNMDPNQEDRVMATVTAEGRDPVLMILKETGNDTGVFKGSINTASYLEEPSRNTLPVRPGDTVSVEYDDPRGAYGEQNRKVEVKIPVAYPVIRLSSSTQ